jgi:hypothetical protein
MVAGKSVQITAWKKIVTPAKEPGLQNDTQLGDRILSRLVVSRMTDGGLLQQFCRNGILR